MEAICQKIAPHLWYDKEARQAAELYTSVLPHSTVSDVSTLQDTPSGDTDIVSFELWGQKFMAISAGPLFKFNPSISFIVNFDPLLFGSSPTPEQAAREKLDAAWESLSEGGKVLMELGEYPFSKRSTAFKARLSGLSMLRSSNRQSNRERSKAFLRR